MEGRKKPAYHFKIEIAHEGVGLFREATAEAEGEVIDLAEPKKIARVAKVGNVTLKRGIDENKGLWGWYQKVILSGVEDLGTRQDCQIQLLDYDGSPIATYAIKQAWPSKLEPPDLKATTNEVAVESIEIAHEGLTLEQGEGARRESKS
jgi:phage tail-like protein